MRQTVKKGMRIGLGAVLVVLGVAGLFLPVLQGVLFLAAGMYLLSREIPWVRRQFLRLRRRFPKAYARWSRAKERAKRLVKGRGRRQQHTDKNGDGP